MATITKDQRVSVGVLRDTHTALANIAKVLGIDVRDAVDEAVRDWNKRKAPEAKRRMAQVLQSA